MNIGDNFTIGSIMVADKRPRWLRLLHWVIRKPAPKRPLQTFRVIAVVGDRAQYEEWL